MRLRRSKKFRFICKKLGKIRLVVYKTPLHIYAQIISDLIFSKVIVSASTLEKKKYFLLKNKGNKYASYIIGKIIAKRSLNKGISNVVFDRSGFKYHGRIKILAESAREHGLLF